MSPDENVNFNYSLCYNDVNSSVDMSSLHMPLPMSTACMHIKENDGSVFIVSPSKKVNFQSYLAKPDIGLLHPTIQMKTWSPNSFTMHGQRTVCERNGI